MADDVRTVDITLHLLENVHNDFVRWADQVEVPPETLLEAIVARLGEDADLRRLLSEHMGL